METWLDIARSNKRAASRLFEEGYYRSAISRAYYAVYARATQALVSQGVSMAGGREGPNHRKVVPMLQANLKKSPWVGQSFAALYLLRCRADYVASDTITWRDGRSALTIMLRIFEML